jgi:hypothetical protein
VIRRFGSLRGDPTWGPPKARAVCRGEVQRGDWPAILRSLIAASAFVREMAVPLERIPTLSVSVSSSERPACRARGEDRGPDDP